MLLVPLSEVTVPLGIFQYGQLTNSIYALMVRGFLGGNYSQTLRSLSVRTSLSIRTIQFTIRDCLRLGWVQYITGPHGERRYSRRAPGPYVPALDPANLSSSETAHKIIILLQMPNVPESEVSWLLMAGCSRATLHRAFKKLSALGLTHGVGKLRQVNFDSMPRVSRIVGYDSGEAPLEGYEVNLLDKSLSKANKPVSVAHGRASILVTYSAWKDSGRPDLSKLDKGDAARVILAHYSYLAASMEDVFIPVNRRGVAAFISVLDWVAAQSDDADGDFEADRVRRLAAGNPQEMVLQAVMATFSAVSTYRKYGVALITTINEDKNTFNSIALNTLIKANKKDPNWRHRLRGDVRTTIGDNLRKARDSDGGRIRLRLSDTARNNPGPGRSGDSS